ncbi:MAG: PEP/pyruvate-binding domain-containing protein [Clostridiaceae bacterium]|nr:PEP/pyruvate-binding domain-containing protein [Clostridiaceae bacterium]
MLDTVSTGINGLDHVVDDLRLGDNVVWQVTDLDDYRFVAQAFLRQALHDQRKVIYIRFASHPSLLDEISSLSLIEQYTPDIHNGFEPFTSQVYQIITQAGPGAFYLFDNLSDLLKQWSSDLMIGNFFRIICPYLFKLNTIAYFALSRGAHSFETIAGIRETTQLLLDLYHFNDAIYVHPLKVWQRYSATMYLPHKLLGDQCIPLKSSADAAIFFSAMNPSFTQASRYIDYWDRLFDEAESLSKQNDEAQSKPAAAMFNRLCSLLLSSEGQIGRLANQYFDLQDMIQIKKREIGTGKIGGKAIGMLLSRKILSCHQSPNGQPYTNWLEPHDSYFLGADLFYTYIVQNGWWNLRTEQKTPEGYFSKAVQLKELLLEGQFPPSIREQFQQLLEFFGQSPIIVRSSSLLEDDFGNAFAGKYESIFCANQGSPADRLAAFEHAVRVVYASTMDADALTYRLKRGLNVKDEQMALLVQRVSGEHHGQYFYPLMAGVGYSNNLYVWNNRLDSQVGMLRLVFGLGTRAVDRVEGDYPRIVALDQPLLSSHDSKEAEKTYSQHYVDLLDLNENTLITLPLDQLAREDKTIDLTEVGEIDWEASKRLAELGFKDRKQWVLNFRKPLSDPQFVETIRNMMEILESVYQYPVDIEFTINTKAGQQPLFNLLQCRPLQTKSIGATVPFPEMIDKRDIFIESKGHFMGGNVCIGIKYIIYVKPEEYAKLTEQDRHQTARIIGQLNQTLFDPENAPTLLLGPGRWGTTTPSLGVPVNFSEIDNIVALGELSFETAGMMPELSFGSHFFQDLVEANVFYLAVLPHQTTNYFNVDILLDKPNIFKKIFPQYYAWANIITVCDFTQDNLTLFSDIMTQKLLCARIAPQKP